MRPSGTADQVAKDPGLTRLFSALFGGLLGLALLKFGNPVVLSKLVEKPQEPLEWVFFAWPVPMAYPLLIGVAVIGVFLALRTKPRFSWMLLLPLGWLGWQFLAATRTVNADLTGAALKQFTACVVCFGLGYFCLGTVRNLSFFFVGLLAAYVFVLVNGFEQHFGGLAESRRHFDLYVFPTLKDPPPELLKRMRSERIFSTLFYPNTLAGVVLLLLPALATFVWECKAWLTRGARLFLMGGLGLASFACLFWSGSKGGWLLAMLLGLIALLHLQFPRWWKTVLVALVVVVGLSGFGLRFAGYFRKGATSVGARMDYWEAATKTTKSNPVFGTGPGTFAIPYQKVKRPESEMSRLVHNDYLQQASDSGLPGFLGYLAFVAVAVVRGYPRSAGNPDWLKLAVWLGVLGWALQGLFEFGLYIPALAWPAFGFMGWLLAGRIEIDRASPPI